MADWEEPTQTYVPSGKGPGPSVALPGKFGTIQLQDHLGTGCGRRWDVWSAVADDGQRLIVEFVQQDRPAPVPPRLPGDPRFILDLSPWEDQGWWPRAIVTKLPVTLPEPHAHVELLDFIGIGGMGQVWLARYRPQASVGSQREEPLLAVKFLIDPDSDLWPVEAQQSLRVEQFLSEHDIGFDATTGSRFVVLVERPPIRLASPVWPAWGLKMRYVSPSLADVIAWCRSMGRRLPVDVVCGILRNLVGALRELHRRGWVHRDLKPSNVLLELDRASEASEWRSGFPGSLAGVRALLSDMGVASRAGELPRLLLNQDGWKSPEQFRNPEAERHRQIPAGNAVQPAEDLYALGLLIRGLASPELIDATDSGWLTAVADKLTSQDPSERPPATQELILELDPNWKAQAAVLTRHLETGGGWRPDEHQNFVGRRFVFTAFDAFRAECDRQNSGGLFLIVGPAGIGKTALLTEWTRRGTHPAFYFRFREGRVLPGAMPRFLCEHLAQRFQLASPPPASNQEAEARLQDLLNQIAREKLGSGGFLPIVVDALDEAAGRTAAAQLIPFRNLPAGVFFIVSSRPPQGGEDHLGLFRDQPYVKSFALDGESEDNLRDSADFWEDRLPGRFTRAEAEQIGRNAGGLFLLLQYWVEGLETNRLKASEVLERPAHWQKLDGSDRLEVWHKEEWDRRIAAELSRDDQDSLDDFASLIAAIRAPVSERQILDWLNWRNNRLNWAMERLSWLLSRFAETVHGRETWFLQARHQSVIDFLIHPKHGPVRHEVGRMHRRIAEHYQSQLTEDWSQIDPYGLHHLPRHLLLSADLNGNREDLKAAVEHLTNLRYYLAAFDVS